MHKPTVSPKYRYRYHTVYYLFQGKGSTNTPTSKCIQKGPLFKLTACNFITIASLIGRQGTNKDQYKKKHRYHAQN